MIEVGDDVAISALLHFVAPLRVRFGRETPALFREVFTNFRERSTSKERRIMTAQSKDRADVHEAVTDRIITMLETAQKEGGKLPWCRPGVASSRPTNALTKQRYNGINILSLWASASSRDYRTGIWATYKQWNDLGAQVRKGETASPIVFYRPLEVAQDDESRDGEEKTKIIRLARGYWGFNADQVNGYILPDEPKDTLVQRIEEAEMFFANIGVPIRHGGAQAYYRPSEDFIQMPEPKLFRDTETSTATEGYYAVLAHEAGHATGARKRLDRDLSGRFGTASYALEELVAELTSANICADLKITAQPREDHAHYIANWLQALRGDNTAIFTAAALAHKAAEYLHGKQPGLEQPTTIDAA